MANGNIRVGLVGAGFSPTILIFSLVGGAIADRVDRRNLLAWTFSLNLAHNLVLAALAANALGRLSLAFVAGPPSYSLPLAAATAAAIASGYAMHTLLPALAALP